MANYFDVGHFHDDPKINAAQLIQLDTLLFMGFIQSYAGLKLFEANSLESFKQMKGVIALVPVLMDFKGNLEITMASRLSTLANTSDQMHTFDGFLKIIKQNFILIECQATVVSFAAVIITTFYLILDQTLQSFERLISLFAIAFSTASLTCSLVVTLISGFIMISGFDPDGIATSLASSLGDCLTVLTFIFFTDVFYKQEAHQNFWSYSAIITLFIVICPILFYGLIKEPNARSLFIQCWPPLILSTLISMVSGFLFDNVNEKFKQTSLLMPMIGGFVGNSISMISNSISINFFRLEQNQIKTFLSLKDVFWNYEYNEKISKNSRSHVIHAFVPCLFIYLVTLTILNPNLVNLTPMFVILFLIFGLILHITMLYLTCNMVHWVFVRFKRNPDDNVIPVMTSIVDCCASMALMIFYQILTWYDDPNPRIQTNEIIPRNFINS
ncbi:RNA binding protein fox-1 2 [Sarcoptes scabiei]|nr:RNA binding protein fox-1 2 [Sarcoptes scabiei]